jgi:hypothetical protein
MRTQSMLNAHRARTADRWLSQLSLRYPPHDKPALLKRGKNFHVPSSLRVFYEGAHHHVFVSMSWDPTEILLSISNKEDTATCGVVWLDLFSVVVLFFCTVLFRAHEVASCVEGNLRTAS